MSPTAVPPPNLPCLEDVLLSMLEAYTSEVEPMPRARLLGMIHRLVNAGEDRPKVRWTDAQLRLAKESLIEERGQLVGSGPEGWHLCRTWDEVDRATAFLAQRRDDLDHKIKALYANAWRRLGPRPVTAANQATFAFHAEVYRPVAS